ncbi:hypothetical protein BDZ45DRAFT_751979 [Acephala macrosclerotiorum]|nr:hypothetical protein BDZ45DRAFT_751979 [Acephala macrosclerotiorum]
MRENLTKQLTEKQESAPPVGRIANFSIVSWLPSSPVALRPYDAAPAHPSYSPAFQPHSQNAPHASSPYQSQPRIPQDIMSSLIIPSISYAPARPQPLLFESNVQTPQLSRAFSDQRYQEQNRELNNQEFSAEQDSMDGYAVRLPYQPTNHNGSGYIVPRRSRSPELPLLAQHSAVFDHHSMRSTQPYEGRMIRNFNDDHTSQGYRHHSSNQERSGYPLSRHSRSPESVRSLLPRVMLSQQSARQGPHSAEGLRGGSSNDFSSVEREPLHRQPDHQTRLQNPEHEPGAGYGGNNCLTCGKRHGRWGCQIKDT